LEGYPGISQKNGGRGMTLKEFIEKMYPLLLNQTLDKIEKSLSEGEIKAYWAGTIIRIDIKPKQEAP